MEEFTEYREEGDFYSAARSYIEFLKCCDDKRKEQFTEELKVFYKEKVEEFKVEGQHLQLIEYTYSYIKLMEGEIIEEELDPFRDDLQTYVQSFIDSELRNMRELEKVSWLMYINRVSASRVAKNTLVELFLGRRNPVMAQKYLDLLFEEHGIEEELHEDHPYSELLIQISDLNLQVTESDKDAIEEMVQSSVEIVVDKGIKTEGGMGVPDQALGTGIVIDPEGYILTNYHIIESDVDPAYEGYSRVYVIPAENVNEKFVAKVVGYDPVYDLALLKIEKEMETHVRIGDSNILRQGERVIAIGNPIGLVNTVTSGVVSSLDRPFLQIGDIIQIDAALNPGNSGGALINKDGYLIGVTFAGLQNFENLNFAIPSDHVLSILNRLYQGKETKRSWIGCAIGEEGDNLIIEYVVPESPADISGLLKGDIIREVNGEPVKDLFDIQQRISYLSHPMIGAITVERNEKELRKKIYLEERPVYPSLYIYSRDAHENIITPIFGMVITRLEGARKKSYVIVKTLYGSVANTIGISEGDVIRLRNIKYDEENKLFYLIIDLKSKRFGYLNKSMVLYSYVEGNRFI
jgi:S1-C subfamily serine protease